MACSAAPDLLKIGRSNNVAGRAAALESSQWFRIKVLAIFPDAGQKENAVHRALRDCRVLDCPGREWFRATLADALAAVTAVDQEATNPATERGETLQASQRSECVVKQFLGQVKSGEYSLGYPPGRHEFTALQMFEMIKGFAAASGAHMNLDSAKSLGHTLSKRYASEAPKVRSRIAKYSVVVGSA